MSYELVEILKKRAESFLKNSERLIQEKEWDLAAFNLEQYCQLILNYLLLLKKRWIRQDALLKNTHPGIRLYKKGRFEACRR